MPVKDLKNVENLAREYRITFAGELNRSEWPDRHRSTFEAIEKLSNKKFETYAADSDINDEPWRVEVRSVASKLREQALRSSQRNESSWRFACEPVILNRISSEVCCQNCRKRLWRSEIEVVPDDNSHAATSLIQRQEAREPCRCPRVARSQDFLEATGLNPIFHYRIDEEVHHGEEISKKLGHAERPDRVYGLRQTRNIENLLYDVAERRFQDTSGKVTKQVQELIELGQPLTQTGDRLLFPFLILEAKSGNAADSWHSIQMQTAFSIRTLLDTQNRLRKATGSFSKWRSGPLIWFLANKGEDWRVSICYVETVQPKSHVIEATEYRIVDVWRGSILSRDGALQLLLLVDFVFDWARDKYRNNIISDLRILASGDNDTASTLYVDSDIYSTIQFDSQNYLDEQSSDVDGVGIAASAQKAFNYDCSAGVIRHATFVESRFHAILVTKDNVQTLLRSTVQHGVRDLCYAIVGLIQVRGLIVDASDIDDFESYWTGTRHAGWAYRHQRQPPYYALPSFCTYLDAKWHIVRELSVIAVASDAWDDMVLASGYGESKGQDSIKSPVGQSLSSDKLISAVKRLRAGSPWQVLLFAINRLSVSLEMEKGNGDISIRKDRGSARYIFHFIYLSAKRGILEPQEPFMRVSKRLDQQNMLDSSAEQLFRADNCVSHEGCVLVTGTCFPADEDGLRRNVCVYLTAGDAQRPSNQDLSRTIKETYETCDVYHTTRNYGLAAKPSVPHLYSTEGEWNLENNYGVYSQSFDFLNLLKKLGGKAPTTQGSPRASSESGSLQYKRNFAPWQDYRIRPTDREQRKFVLYKIFSQEIAFWRSVAENRRAEGVTCCTCCATVGPIDICQACRTILNNPNTYTWMKRCLKGEAPFERTKPSESEVKSRLDSFPNRTRWPMCQGAVKGRDDDDWARFLDFYPRLDENFRDIQQLATQWRAYKTYCEDLLGCRRKRKRSSKASRGFASN